MAWATMGATALVTPTPNSWMQMNSALARAAAARYLPPSQPTMITSVVISAFCASCATISGQPSWNRARNSLPQL